METLEARVKELTDQLAIKRNATETAKVCYLFGFCAYRYVNKVIFAKTPQI